MVSERTSEFIVIAIFIIGGTISFLAGLRRADPWAVGIGVFLIGMAFIQWRLR